MKQEKIDRINELARKAKADGLTVEEEAEREALRLEYKEAILGSLRSHLLIKARHAFSHLDHKNVLSLSRCC